MDREIPDYDSYKEEYPYDVSAAAEHFQTPQEFINTLDRYREHREREIWELQQIEIDQLTKENEELKKEKKEIELEFHKFIRERKEIGCP